MFEVIVHFQKLLRKNNKISESSTSCLLCYPMLVFPLILSFYSMLARNSSSAMSGKFVQCWGGICSNWLISKFYDNALSFFLYNLAWSLLGNAQGSLALQCCPKSIKITLNKIFTCAMLSQEY